MANRRPLVLVSGNAAELPTGDTLITSGGQLEIGAGGTGYGTGSGGVATQITSRTTGVTLSKTNGAITLFSAVTTASLVTSFTITNTLVGANDTVVASIKTATAGIYFLSVSLVSAGSFRISVFTPAAVATAEAPVITFAVVKAAIA